MSTPKPVPDLPAASVEPQQLLRFIEAVREVIQTREGRRGSPYEEGVTFRDLVDLGLAQARAAGGWTGGTGIVGPQGDPGPAGPPGTPYVPDYTPPPTPTGLTAVPLYSGALIKWGAPVYTQGHGNAYTKVYVAQYAGSGPLPTFSGATYTGAAGGATTMYVHEAPMGTQLHVWVAFVTTDGVEGSPAGGTNGVQVTTSPDIAELLDVLTGAITESQLATALATRIDLIDSLGTNLLQNSSFEFDTDADGLADSWVAYNPNVTSTSSSIATDRSVNGQKSQHRSGTSPASSSANRLGLYQNVPVPSAQVGLDLTLSASIAGTAGALGRVFLQFRDAADAAMTPTYTGPNVTMTGPTAFQRTSVTGVVPAGAVTARCYAWIHSFSGVGDIYADAAQLQEGALTVYLGDQIAAIVQNEIDERITEDAAIASDVSTITARLTTGGDVYESIVQVDTKASAKSAHFVQASAPSNPSNGIALRVDDIWLDSDDGNKAYRWSGSAWVAADDARIGTQASQITTLQSTVSGFGANLLANSSFEIDSDADGLADSWVAYTLGSVTGAAWSQSASAFVHGAVSQKCTFTSSGGGTGDRIGARQDVPLAAGMVGETLTLSASVCGTSGAGSRMTLSWRNSGGSVISTVNSTTATLTGVGNFQRMSVQGVVPSGTATARVIIWLQSVAGAAEFDIDATQLQEGELTGYIGSDMAVAIQQEISTRASAIDGVEAKYSVKVDINGYIAGFGLLATANDAAPTSDFFVRADRFAIMPPIDFSQESQPTVGMVTGDLWRKTSTGVIKAYNGTSWVSFATPYPFIVQTTVTTENGVTINPGVYIDAAYIKNLYSIYANIANLVADDINAASISVAQLVAGSFAVGEYAQSTGYVAGSSGWRISGSGAAEFSGVTVRGTVEATAGSFGGVTISGALTFNTTGIIKGGQTAYNTGTGFFIGYSGAAYKVSVGSSTAGFTWDGSAFSVYGGTFKVGTNPAVSGSTMTGTGAVLNADGTFAIGNSTKNLSFNGSTLTLNGQLVVNGNIADDAVDTPKVADGTIRAFAAATATSTVGYLSWGTLLTASPALDVGSTGKVALVATIDFINGYGPGGENDAPSQVAPSFRIKRGSTVLATWTPGVGPLVASRALTSYTYIDTPGSGSHTYSLEMQDDSGGSTTAVAKNRSLTAMGIKK